MPKIDTLLRMMSEKEVERAVLRADQPYLITTAGRTVEAVVIHHVQLVQLVEEIVPPSLAQDLKSGRPFNFQHVSPFGSFDFTLGHENGLQVEIKPMKAASTAVSSPLVAQPVFPPVSQTLSSSSPKVIAPISPPVPAELGTIPSSPADTPATLPTYPATQHQAPGQPPYGSSSPSHPPHYPLPYDPQMGQKSSRSKVAAGLFGILLAPLGVHRFYLGYTGIGVVYLILTFVLSLPTCGLTFYVTCIWGLIEGIIILCDGMKDADGLPLQ
jgi:TM2 domain-containing membrane protein YozV